jgi:hypothetical protein
MRPDDLRRAMQHKPFRQVRLHLTNGNMFEITHPDLAIVGRSTVTLSLPYDEDYRREAVIALVHVVWMEVVVDEFNI